MRSYLFAGLLALILAAPALALEVDESGRTEAGPLNRSAYVLARGVTGVATIPCDIYRTGRTEIQSHRWLWPFTMLPRQFTNIVARTASSAHDFFIAPWAIAPYTDDITPMSEGLGLPDFPCQRQ